MNVCAKKNTIDKQMLCDIKKLNQVLLDRPFLYGAGKVGETVVKYAAMHNLPIDGIFVSDLQGNPTQIMGIPVLLMSAENTAKKTVIVSVKENLQDEIKEIVSRNKFEKIYYISDGLFDRLTYKSDEISALITKQYFNNKILWNRAAEREALRENWGIITEERDFPEKYGKLIDGLDSESIETIARILNRIRLCLKCDAKEIDLFTRKECEELIYLREHFFNLIIKNSSELYIFRNYYLPYYYFLPGVFVYKHGIERVTNISAIEGKTILDVGGFIGDSVLVLEELKPKKIITFEAVADNAALLYKTLELNNLKNVEVVKAALGDCVGTVMMNLHGSASSCVDRGGVNYEGSVEVPIMTLDHYVEENDIQDIALIKVDIEGAEMDFLRGAKETIRRFRPTLLLSIYHSAHDFFGIKPMLDEWNLGYRFSVYKPIDGSIANDTMLIAEYVEE